MKRALMLAVAAGLLLSGRPASACSCALRGAPQYLADADVVFAGEVVTIVAESEGSVVALFDVETVYKGDPGRSVRVRTGGDEAGCGVPFQDGVVYVVFAQADGDVLTAGLCGGTTEDRRALEREGIEPLREYGPRATPPAGAPSPPGAAIPAASPSSPSRGGPIAVAWLALASAAVLLLRARSGRNPRMRDPGT